VRQSGAPVNPFPWENAEQLASRRLGSAARRALADPASKRGAASLNFDPPSPAGEETAGFWPVSAFVEPESVKQSRLAREPPLPFQEPIESHCGLPVEGRICSAGATRTARRDAITECTANPVVQAFDWSIRRSSAAKIGV